MAYIKEAMNKEIKLKKNGTPKKSGGARATAGRKRRTVTPGPGWEQQLERGLRLAANNMFILPRTKFFTKTEFHKAYGTKASTEFSRWFKSVLRFDPDKVDAVRQKLARGEYNEPPKTWPEKDLKFYTPQKYADHLAKKCCFSWMSVLRSEHHREVWEKYADHGKI